eukprot:m.225227 g.225227  ORF g.225227 m.225227 type:complete len:667 (+) comp18783_c1_seq10:2107-4107(+)
MASGFVGGLLVLVVVVVLTAQCNAASPTVHDAKAVTINLAPSNARDFKHFWKSCGWCPPEPHVDFDKFFLQEDMLQNHETIGSVPHGGIRYVRIHYLIDLVKNVAPAPSQNTSNITVFGSGFLAGKAVDWSALDKALDQVVNAGLKPGFEVMGNPGDSLFDDFGKHDQVMSWHDFIYTLVSRYVQRYGKSEVLAWRFESWNEPEGQCPKQLTVGIKCNMLAFLNYFDATISALRRIDDGMVFGGPASDGDHAMLFALIEHCKSGRNYVTGQAGCPRIDYLNAHLKGNSDTQAITDKELPIALKVQAMVKGTALEHSKWGNDEADPLVGWNRIEEWRADARYAAMVPKAILKHQVAFIQDNGIDYELLGNDNGFLPYGDNQDHLFSQRTLVARWDMNLTHTVEVVRKPVLNVMALLAKLGTRLYNVTGTDPVKTATVGVIATTLSASSSEPVNELAVLVYNSDDSSNANGTTNLTLNLVDVPSSLSDAAVAVFHLDNTHGSAYSAWQAMGRPTYPSAAQFATLRKAMEIPMALSVLKTLPAEPLHLEVALPGVALVHACAKTYPEPEAPTGVRLHRTPTKTPPEILVRWQEPPQRCVKTYVVQFMPQQDASPSRVNANDTIFTGFLHAMTADQAHAASNQPCYAVTTVDYFGRESKPSPSVCLQSGQ